MNVFLPEKCNASDIKVLQISDMHLFATTEQHLVGVNTEQSFLSILQLAQEESWPPDLIFLTGDLSQDASEASYTRLIEHLTGLNIPCYVLPGNHDIPDTLTHIFSQQPVSYQPFLHHGKWLFAFLDSETPGEEGGTLNEKAVEELQIEINQHPDKHVLICLHHQLKPVGSEWLDTMAVINPDSLIKVIDESPNVLGIIHGHVHQTFESDIAGIPIYAVPSTCFQFKPLCKAFAIDNIAPGYRWLRLQATGQIQTDVIRLDKTPDNLDQHSAGY
ncbi:MAG TPA: 3',5'-cyclic-AMP phosphodiesterase [Cycloclasticus sp.]|jgi:Icc protein|nr:3',5'-cyclic-AMP phosphodiesterase [Cycloclasticus sp.]HIL91709.1 3',5'-cyclic-AMP phosphodiesterase [Cycloclasticus sp.]